MSPEQTMLLTLVGDARKAFYGGQDAVYQAGIVRCLDALSLVLPTLPPEGALVVQELFAAMQRDDRVYVCDLLERIAAAP